MDTFENKSGLLVNYVWATRQFCENGGLFLCQF